MDRSRAKQNLGTFRIAEHARKHCSTIQSQLRPKPVFPLDGIDPDEDATACRAAEDQARRELGDTYQLIEIGDAATLDGLMKELATEERLDVMIDRCLKRLLFLRGIKSLSSAASSAPLPRIPGPQKAA